MQVIHMRNVILLLLISLVFTSCGYRPSSNFARMALGEKISTSVIISNQNPGNTVIIKDAMDSAIVKTLHASLVPRSESDSHLVFSIATPNYYPVQYNANGYIIAYRMKVRLTITRYHDGEEKRYTAQGISDFSIAPNAVVTVQARFDAIELAAAKAINSFIAQISSEGARKVVKNDNSNDYKKSH